MFISSSFKLAYKSFASSLAMSFAVEAKQIADAYLVVLEKEPVHKDSPLARAESIKLSAHIVSLMVETQSQIAMLIVEEADRVPNGGQSLC